MAKSKARARAKAKAKAPAKAKAKAKASAKATATAKTKPGTKTAAGTKSKAGTKTKTSASTKTSAGAGAGTKTTAGTKTSAGTKTNNKTQPATAKASGPMTTNSSAPWREALRAAASAAGSGQDFSTHVQKLGTDGGWEHADTPELVGLEKWGTALAKQDRAAGIGALVLAARAAFPEIVERGGDALEGMGVTGKEGDPIHDGAAVEVQLARAERWLDDPKANQKAVDEAFDKTRQLYVWDEDLRPQDDDSSFYFVTELGQLPLAAILGKKSEDDGGGYYEWSPEVTVGRGLVVVARAMRAPEAKPGAILTKLHEAFAHA